MSYAEMLKAAKAAKLVRPISPKYFEFKKDGDGFVGRLRAISTVESSAGSGTYQQYLFETDFDLIKCAFGAATDKEAGALMEVGAVYSVTFRGKEKISGGRTVNKFDVSLIDVAEISDIPLAGKEE